MGKLIGILFVLSIIYWAIASTVFEFRNPKANRVQPFVHPIEVITFQKLPEFQ